MKNEFYKLYLLLLLNSLTLVSFGMEPNGEEPHCKRIRLEEGASAQESNSEYYSKNLEREEDLNSKVPSLGDLASRAIIRPLNSIKTVKELEQFIIKLKERLNNASPVVIDLLSGFLNQYYKKILFRIFYQASLLEDEDSVDCNQIGFISADLDWVLIKNDSSDYDFIKVDFDLESLLKNGRAANLTQLGDQGFVNGIVVSRDKKRIISYGLKNLTVYCMEETQQIDCSPDERGMSEENFFKIKFLTDMKEDCFIYQVSLSPDNHSILVTLSNELGDYFELFLFDLNTKEKRCIDPSLNDTIHRTEFIPHENRALIARDSGLFLIDLENPEKIVSKKVLDGRFTFLKMSENGRCAMARIKLTFESVYILILGLNSQEINILKIIKDTGLVNKTALSFSHDHNFILGTYDTKDNAQHYPHDDHLFNVILIDLRELPKYDDTISLNANFENARDFSEIAKDKDNVLCCTDYIWDSGMTGGNYPMSKFTETNCGVLFVTGTATDGAAFLFFGTTKPLSIEQLVFMLGLNKLKKNIENNQEKKLSQELSNLANEVASSDYLKEILFKFTQREQFLISESFFNKKKGY